MDLFYAPRGCYIGGAVKVEEGEGESEGDGDGGGIYWVLV